MSTQLTPKFAASRSESRMFQRIIARRCPRTRPGIAAVHGFDPPLVLVVEALVVARS